MASIVIPYSKHTVTSADSAGVVTVVSTAALHTGMVGSIYLSSATPPSRTIQITEILGATTFRAKFFAKIDDDNFTRGSNAAYRSNTNGSDLSAWTGGSAYVAFEEQLVTVDSFGNRVPHSI